MTNDKVSDHPSWDKYQYTKHTDKNMSEQFGKSTEHLTAENRDYGGTHVTTVSGTLGNGTSPTDGGQKGKEPEEYKVYKWRWYVLATLAVLNFSNAMAWICFAAVTNITAQYYNVTVDDVNWLSLVYLVVTVPIGFVASWALDTLGLRAAAWICFAAVTNITAQYYNVTVDDVNWLSLVYLVVTVPIGFVASWALDTLGLRAAMLLGGWANLIGLIVRYLSTLPVVPESGRFAVVMTGQGIAAFAQPFLLFAPTKLAAIWFPTQQRAIANTLGSMSNPLGILCSFLLSAGLVSAPEDLPLMLWVYIIPGGVAAAMVTLGICSSTPPTPPTSSAASDHESFFQGLKKCVKNLPYMILFMCFGAGYGLFNALSTFLEQIVCPQGYNDDFAGLLGGLMIACGIGGAIISGLYVDKTKRFTPVVKITFTMAALFCIVFIVCAQFPKLGIGMAVGAVGFGFFGFAMFPIALELGVECTYPVAEGTSAGILQISGQLQGVILIMVGQFAAQTIQVEDAPDQQCVPTNSSEIPDGGELVTSIPDMSIPMYIFGGYAVLACVLLLILFKTEYKRVNEERREPVDTETTQF